MKSLLVAVAASLALGGPALADEFEALRADSRIHDGLLVVAIGERIVEGCPSISERRLAVNAFGLGLYNRARSLGFTHEQVVAFVESEAEKARYRSLAERYFAQNGVTSADDSEGACRIGRDEIARGTSVGRFLRER